MISPEHDHTEIENLENFQDSMAFYNSKENQSIGTPVVELESQTTNTISEGILYGLVCGIMVCICVKELLPTAFRFAGDKTHFVAIGIFFGMFVMITSLALFGYAGA
ncbi:Zinc (Zn2)-Iron (Fe2) Permease [Phytophthora megakarya]|uniref:Zinc (Zn2)-Iron (Fe2) Permease n=1 Tax=Phytophthora megakarya TaxID=4795 RepID=A0A225WV62_9STRA|nr:Zinc (Zn2)-Iron (Fe2) Permease [Phytophthora megakarya]